MKLFNLIYAGFMIISSSLVGSSINKNSNISHYQNSFTMDVSKFKSELSISLKEAAPGREEIYAEETIRFGKSFSLGFEDFKLPENVDPTEFTKVNRTDDASVRVAFKNKGIVEDNLVKISTFDPFSIINFRNMHKYNSIDDAKLAEEENNKVKEDTAGISEQATMESWYIDENNNKVVVLRISFISYVSLYWIQTNNNSFLGATMLVEVDFTPFLDIYASELYTFDFNMALGSIVKFS